MNDLPGWRIGHLEQLASVNPETLSVIADPDWRFRYIDLSSVERGQIKWDKTAELTMARAPSRARRPIKPKDVLFGNVRPTLQSHGLISVSGNEPLIASTGFTVLRARADVDANYLFHLIMSQVVQAEAHRYEVGSSYPAVNESDVRKFVVPIPPLADQRRIARVLDTADDLMQSTERLIAKLEQIKQGLLHDLLTRGIDNHGALRDPFGHKEQFGDSPLGVIPRAWHVRSVGSLLRDIEQGWSPDCPEEPASVGRWGVLKTSAVVWDGYQDCENKALPPTLLPRPEYEVHVNDVLMTRAGPSSRVGVVALVQATQGQLMLSDKLYRLVPKGPILSAFLAIVLSGARIQRHLSTVKTGLAESQTNISQDIVRMLPVGLPPIHEQEMIVERMRALNGKIEAEQSVVAKLRHMKTGLMDDLLTG